MRFRSPLSDTIIFTSGNGEIKFEFKLCNLYTTIRYYAKGVMYNMKRINIGLLGAGTVGSGVIKILTENADIISKRLGFELNLKKIYSRSIRSDVKKRVEKLIVDDYKELLEDDIDITVELIGGEEFAKDFVLESIEKKKSVVTANKALLANYGFEIFQKAFSNRVDVGYEASVAGGIPIIKAIKESLSANNILSIRGIVNGTCNYILTKMLEDEKPFEEVLKTAQDEGFAEKDPSFDVDGIDSAHKMAILSSISFGTDIKEQDVYTEGIRDITYMDIKFADDLGYRIKLLGIANTNDKGIDVRVHPAMIKKGDILAKIDGAYNAIKVCCDMAEDTVYIGKGAGSLPTASAVVSDIMDIARNIKHSSHLRIPLMSFPFNYVTKKEIVDINNLKMRYYLRFTVKDSAGMLSKISGVLGEKNISIKSVIQPNKDSQWVPLMVMTHDAYEKDVKEALSIIDKMSIVKDKTLLIRVEDE